MNTEYWCKRGHFNEDQYNYVRELVKKENPKYCLETGFCTGRSALSVLYENENIEKFVNVDINYNYLSEGMGMLKKFVEKWKNFKAIQSSSSVVLNDNFFKEEFPNGLDWFTVDGDHSYAGCVNDIEKAIPYMNEGGIIIIDDYMSGPPNGCRIPEVTRACDDMYKKYETKLERRVWNNKGKGFCIFKICAKQ